MKSTSVKIDAKMYEEMCSSAKTPQDIRPIVKIMEAHWEDNFDCDILLYYKAKILYNRFIGWAMPTQQVCDLVFNFWKKQPGSTIVDVGAGSGLFCMMFHDAGVAKNKLLAVEPNITPTKYQVVNTFWEITRHDKFEVAITDIFFIAWGGGGGISNCLQSYIERGGRYVIILGETDDGCTFPSDFFIADKDWTCEMIHVIGPASPFAEHISFNVRNTLKEQKD